MVERTVAGRQADHQLLFEKLPLGLLVIHRDGNILLSNAAAAEKLGAPCTPGSKSPLFLPPGQHQVPSPSLEDGPLQVTVHDFAWQGQATYLTLLEASPSLGWTSQDTEQLAYEDPLTGLPNLNILKQFIDFTCTQALRYKRSAALILVDIDDFRGLKQQLGEAASDQLLVDVASRLQQTVRSSDLVGRRGQDQFIVLLTELTEDRSIERPPGYEALSIQDRASRVGERILREFEVPLLSRDVPVTCRVSLGLTVCPEQATTPEDMLHQAEAALRQAKSLGGERLVIYDRSLDLSQTQRHDRAEQIVQALRSQALQASRDPWWDLQTGAAVAHQFVPVVPALSQDFPGPLDLWCLAEEEGFSAELFEWALAELARSQHKPHVLPLSSSQLLHRELPSSLPLTLREAGVNPQDCIILVSEATILRDMTRRISMLRALREQGFALALDLGATGLGSVHILSQLHPDWLRISRRSSLFPSLLKIAPAMGIQVLAFEVDDEEQAAAARSLGARAYSGKAR